MKKNVATYIVYLAAHNMSGYNVCKFSTKGCRARCLVNSGRSKYFDKINKARIVRTKTLFEEPELFTTRLVREIENAQKLWTKKGYEFAVRINGTSDLDITNINGLNLLERFPDITFYDYTKNPNLESKYDNYHITYSYSGEVEHQWDRFESKLLQGKNVSVVFHPKVPETFKGFTVINGDETDLRYTDPQGVIVGLKYKRTKGDDLSTIHNDKFVISTYSEKLN